MAGIDFPGDDDPADNGNSTLEELTRVDDPRKSTMPGQPGMGKFLRNPEFVETTLFDEGEREKRREKRKIKPTNPMALKDPDSFLESEPSVSDFYGDGLLNFLSNLDNIYISGRIHEIVNTAARNIEYLVPRLLQKYPILDLVISETIRMDKVKWIKFLTKERDQLLLDNNIIKAHRVNTRLNVMRTSPLERKHEMVAKWYATFNLINYLAERYHLLSVSRLDLSDSNLDKNRIIALTNNGTILAFTAQSHPMTLERGMVITPLEERDELWARKGGESFYQEKMTSRLIKGQESVLFDEHDTDRMVFSTSAIAKIYIVPANLEDPRISRDQLNIWARQDVEKSALMVVQNLRSMYDELQFPEASLNPRKMVFDPQKKIQRPRMSARSEEIIINPNEFSEIPDDDLDNGEGTLG